MTLNEMYESQGDIHPELMAIQSIGFAKTKTVRHTLASRANRCDLLYGLAIDIVQCN
jgi:hypothetical protein